MNLQIESGYGEYSQQKLSVLCTYWMKMDRIVKTVLVETIGYCSICWFHGMIQANIEIQISSIIFGGIP